MFAEVNYINCKNANEEYRMVYYSWGVQEKSSKTLVCLHGLNRNGRDWDYIAQHFVKQGYLVIAPDIVGRGNSDYLINANGYDTFNYAADILKLIGVLSLENVCVLGTSMGGLVGMAIAYLPQNPIKKLILNDIGAELEYDGLVGIASYSNSHPEFNNFNDAKDYIISLSLDFGALPDYIWEHIARNSFQKNLTGRYELKRDVNLSKTFTNEASENKNIELWNYWGEVTIPTLVIHGENSTLLSKATISKMQKIHPLTQTVEIKNTGHAPFLYDDEHCDIISNFLG
jgi:pimeloyl-ACP methyl ester carboxylesterase